MEFLLTSNNIEIKLSENETVITNKDFLCQNPINKNNLLPQSQLFSIFLCLDDYYLINNLKIIIPQEKDDIFQLSSIHFQTTEIGKWEKPLYFNPDGKDVITRDNNAISIFCVGLTDYIKFDFILLSREVAIPDLISKIIIYSQYLYSIPNATFLLALLNIKNFFQNVNIDDNAKKQIKDNNYYCSLYLTATSMIQARLFIQAWELLTTLQKIIVEKISSDKNDNLDFFYIMFEVEKKKEKTEAKNKENGDLIEIDSIILEEKKNDLNDENISIFITHIELIKAVCMYEHGHFYVFLNCLKNCIDFYTKHDYSILHTKISLAKVNDIYNDKFYVLNFLNDNGEQLSDILIRFLKNKNEILKYSTLKVFEFIMDYNPIILVKYISKIMNFLFHSNTSIKHNVSDSSIINQLFSDKELFLSKEDFGSLVTDNNKDRHKCIIDNDKKNNKHCISQILQKQINYTLDTIINNLDSFHNEILTNILIDNSSLLFDIISSNETENLVNVIALKVIKKCFENLDGTFYTKPNKSFEFVFRLFIMGIKKNIKEIFNDYLSIQKKVTNFTQYPNKNSKEIKEIIHNSNNIISLIATLQKSDELIDTSNEIGNMIKQIIDQLSDDMIYIDKNNNFLDYVNISIDKLVSYLELNLNDNDDNKDFDQCIFYLYILLEFIICLLLPKNKIEYKTKVNETIYSTEKSDNMTDFTQKMKLFITNLFKIEKITLINRKLYLLFEVSIEVLITCKDVYNSIFKDKVNEVFDYSSYFVEQYVSLNDYIKSNGIFSDNIKFILKTLKLCELNNEILAKTIKEIFIIFLSNFTNYYTEESFAFFALITESLGKAQLIDKELFTVITNAIVLKSNYKGNSFKQCYTKYFEVVFINEKYYNYFNENMIEEFTKFNAIIQDIKGCSNKYLEFIDRIDLAKKYYEYFKEMVINRQIDLSEETKETKNLLNEISKIAENSDDTIRNKLNNLVDSILGVYEQVKFLLDMNNFGNDLCKYFTAINKKSNPYLLNENIKIIEHFIRNIIGEKVYYDNKLTQMFINVFASVDLDIVKNIKNKRINVNIMKFHELLCSIHVSHSKKSEITRYIEKVINYYFQSNDEFTILFGLDLLFLTNREDLSKNDAFYLSYLDNFPNILQTMVNLIMTSNNYKVKILFYKVMGNLVNNYEQLNDKKCLNEFYSDYIREYIITPYLNMKKKIFSENKDKSDSNEDNEKNEGNDYDYSLNNINDGEDIYDDYKYNPNTNISHNDQENKITSDNIENISQNPVLNIINEINNIPIEVDNNNNTVNNQRRDLTKEEDDNLSLEDLGVVEVEDEIFDNLDDKNIPILKKNCDRSKGISAKLKTNQNSKSLLMSEHVTQP